MENKEKNQNEQDVQIYGARRPVKARRDVSEQASDGKTRTDIPSFADETVVAAAKKAKRDLERKESENPQKVYKLEEDEPEEVSGGRGIFAALGKSLGYVVFVICASIIVSYIGITTVNDLFAFVKSDAEVEIVVDESTTFRELAGELEKKGVVQYPLLLRVYNSFKNRDRETPQELEAGEYKILANLNYDEIIATFSKKAPAREIVRITFPEGLTADETIELFLENGVGTREGFVEAISSSLVYDMDYRFLKELQALETEGFENGRRYALEGYLYPDTYDFYTDSSEIDAISKLLETFNRRFEEAYYDRCIELDMTVDDVINLASIVQMETKYESEYETVSSLYHNRLNNPYSFPRLQCDSTYLYAFPERRAELTLDEMKSSDSPYSTYSHDGLPPSAICSPSLNAIISALYPNAVDNNGVDHTYYYMVARPNGYHYFAQTEAGHLQNIAKAEKEAE
ncbi:MAG: endolytic transglycosylase MltG [Clostridia bacterium]|nr:endolytic transglycosylase MltG [Clostridia bacterium]